MRVAPMTLAIRPIGLREANDVVTRIHRHHGSTQGHKFSISCVDTASGEVVGVAIAGRPVARKFDNGASLEVTRVATDGTRNACSMLYGAMRRIALAMGYEAARVITYTLKSESGVSLVAAGWTRDAESPGGSWSVPSRPRVDKAPLEPKVRWHA